MYHLAEDGASLGVAGQHVLAARALQHRRTHRPREGPFRLGEQILRAQAHLRKIEKEDE